MVPTKLNDLKIQPPFCSLENAFFWQFIIFEFHWSPENKHHKKLQFLPLSLIVWLNETLWHNWMKNNQRNWMGFYLMTPFTGINYGIVQSRLPGTRAGFPRGLGFFICVKFAKQWPRKQHCLSRSLSHRWPSEIWAPSLCVVAKSN